jgi:putative acyl-CoA dehydrogenase
MATTRGAVDAFLAEVEEARGDSRLDPYVARLRSDLRDMEEIEARARGLVERMALALQGSLLLRFGDPAVADAFCSSRLAGEWGHAFGTLPRGTDFARIVERHRAV